MQNKTFVIAEIGTSHSGNFEKAKKLIDAAFEAGADAVKFQWVYADEILHPDTGFVDLPGGKIRLYDSFKSLEVEPKFFRDCLSYAHEKKIKFACSPFGLRSLKKLLEIKPDYIKIASPELNHIPLLKALADFRAQQEKNLQEMIPVIISSGVSKLQDIQNAIELLGTKNLTLLHCITFYPAPEEQYNLRLIKTLAQKFNIKTGVSDHSLSPILVPSLAVSQGASMIEKHITLSHLTDGLDDKVALIPEDFALMCHCVHQSDAVMRHYGNEKGEKEIIRQLESTEGKERIEKILGDGIKKLAPIEEQNYGRTNRSLHFVKNLKKGAIIKKEDIAVLRTEKNLTAGISPIYLENTIGKTLTRDVKSGEGVLFTDFS